MSNSSVVNGPQYTDETLEEAPAVAAKFLTGIAADSVIRTVLFKAGMGDKEIDEGRRLLNACLAAPPAHDVVLDTEEAKAARAAGAELNSLDEPCYAVLGKALARRAPAVGTFLFADLKASTAVPQAIIGWKTFFLRLDQVEKNDPAVGASKKEVKVALQLIAERGYPPAEIARLKKLVKKTDAPTSVLQENDEANHQQERLVKLSELKAWLDDWTTTARYALVKKTHRIRVGIASRKPPTKKVAGGSDAKGDAAIVGATGTDAGTGTK